MADEEPTPATGEEPQQENENIEVPEGARDPDAVRNAIKAERDAAKAERKRADDLAAKVKQFEDAGKSAQEKADEKASSAEKRAEQAEMKALRFEVAAKAGVPLSQAHRLQGTTKDELEADAADFLKDVKPGPAGGQMDGGARSPASTPEDMDSMIRAAAGYR